MNDGDARYYQEHKDDEEEWGEGEGEAGRGGARRLTLVVSVRLSPDQEDLIRSAAESMGLSISSFIRSAAVRSAGIDRSQEDVAHLFGGWFGSLDATVGVLSDAFSDDSWVSGVPDAYVSNLAISRSNENRSPATI